VFVQRQQSRHFFEYLKFHETKKETPGIVNYTVQNASLPSRLYKKTVLLSAMVNKRRRMSQK
jgi:hypothetical protein